MLLINLLMKLPFHQKEFLLLFNPCSFLLILSGSELTSLLWSVWKLARNRSVCEYQNCHQSAGGWPGFLIWLFKLPFSFADFIYLLFYLYEWTYFKLTWDPPIKAKINRSGISCLSYEEKLVSKKQNIKKRRKKRTT